MASPPLRTNHATHHADLWRGLRSNDLAMVATDHCPGRRGYDYAQHGRATSTHVDFVTDDVIDRFCLLGPVEAHLERLRELAALGVDQFARYL